MSEYNWLLHIVFDSPVPIVKLAKLSEVDLANLKQGLEWELMYFQSLNLKKKCDDQNTAQAQLTKVNKEVNVRRLRSMARQGGLARAKQFTSASQSHAAKCKVGR